MKRNLYYLLFRVTNNISLEPYLKETFGFEITKWHKTKNIQRIHWISNCNKHNDGYPKTAYKPKEFEHLPENEKLKLSKDDFLKDIEQLTAHYTNILEIVFYLAKYKMLCNDVVDIDTIEDDALKQQMIENKKELTMRMKDLINLL